MLGFFVCLLLLLFFALKTLILLCTINEVKKQVDGRGFLFESLHKNLRPVFDVIRNSVVNFVHEVHHLFLDFLIFHVIIKMGHLPIFIPFCHFYSDCKFYLYYAQRLHFIFYNINKLVFVFVLQNLYLIFNISIFPLVASIFHTCRQSPKSSLACQ